MTPTSQTATLPRPETEAEGRESTGSLVCADDGVPAPAGHHIVPRPQWVKGKPAAFPATTL